MKCDTCNFKKIHFGAGPPDDYSMEYCSKEHWEGGDFEENETVDFWENCQDFEQTPIQDPDYDNQAKEYEQVEREASAPTPYDP